MRYYFDIRDNTGLYPDEEGLEFRTQREAEIEAIESLAGLVRDLVPTNKRQDAAVEVRSDVDRLFEVALIFSASRTKQ
jgi:hypothetical protein